MFYSRTTFSADGVTSSFVYPFPYIASGHLSVYLDGVLKVVDSDYTFNTSTHTVTFLSPPALGVDVLIKRTTPRGDSQREVVFQDPSDLRAETLNLAHAQTLYILQELLDDVLDEGLGVIPPSLPGFSGDNTFFGSDAFISNTTGTTNTAVGYRALRVNLSGSHNTGIGADTLLVNTSGIRNTALGSGAMRGMLSGRSNTAVGVESLYGATTAEDNVAAGYRALHLLTTGLANTAVGVEALYSSTSSSSNTAVGYRASKFNTTGKENTAVGQEALAANTTADASVGVGYRALYASNGTRNTGVGYQAMLSCTIGTENTAIGMNAMQALVEGSGQVALGVNALYSLTPTVADSTTNDHVGIGKSAGHFCTTSKRTTLVGGFCGYGLTTQDGNTMVGYKAGYVASGAKNTVVGTEANPATFSGCVVLGFGATANASNQLVLGASGADRLLTVTPTISGTAGSGVTALPALPQGYLKVRLNGVNVVIPYYYE
jgi:hypothetical protein